MPDHSQTVMFRVIMGAIKNTLDGHPEWKVPRDFARSVAKRAAGTLASLPAGAALAAAKRSAKRKPRSPDGKRKSYPLWGGRPGPAKGGASGSLPNAGPEPTKTVGIHEGS